jgi:putative intracellular protease/amidase
MKILLPTILFLLVSATSAFTQSARKGKVLVIVSSENTIPLKNGKIYQTGYFLNELTVPIKRLQEEGYAITFANPKGNSPAMDIHSDSASFFDNDRKKYQAIKIFHDRLVGLKSPKVLKAIVRDGLAQYDAVFFPGGHAPMQDLLKDPDVRQVLMYFHRTGKPTALICHAPISLLSTMPQAGKFVAAMQQGDRQQAANLAANWQYRGYKMTIFSTSEEKIAEMNQLGGKMLFYPEAAMKVAGGDLKVAQPWKSQVVQDRELITGQNPFSDDALAETLVKAIEQKQSINK